MATGHSCLRQRETCEYAHCIERDEFGDVGAQDEDQRRGGTRKRKDAVGEDQPMTSLGELARQE